MTRKVIAPYVVSTFRRTLMMASAIVAQGWILAFAQSTTTPPASVYTEAQAKRGDTIYAKACASCHGADLAGDGQMPALAGKDFEMTWSGMPLSDLFERIHATMPADKPGSLTPAEAADDTAFDKVIENNLKTVWMACQEGARAMRQRGGSIVVISSVLAERGVPGASLYCAAKGAVANLVRALALEWAREKIRINLLEAGWMAEEGSPALANDEFAANLLKYLPYKRLVKPEELAGALLYLASPASGFVTGEAIAVDGGLLCRV